MSLSYITPLLNNPITDIVKKGFMKYLILLSLLFPLLALAHGKPHFHKGQCVVVLDDFFKREHGLILGIEDCGLCNCYVINIKKNDGDYILIDEDQLGVCQ